VEDYSENRRFFFGVKVPEHKLGSLARPRLYLFFPAGPSYPFGGPPAPGYAPLVENFLPRAAQGFRPPLGANISWREKRTVFPAHRARKPPSAGGAAGRKFLFLQLYFLDRPCSGYPGSCRFSVPTGQKSPPYGSMKMGSPARGEEFLKRRPIEKNKIRFIKKIAPVVRMIRSSALGNDFLKEIPPERTKAVSPEDGAAGFRNGERTFGESSGFEKGGVLGPRRPPQSPNAQILKKSDPMAGAPSFFFAKRRPACAGVPSIHANYFPRTGWFPMPAQLQFSPPLGNHSKCNGRKGFFF